NLDIPLNVPQQMVARSTFLNAETLRDDANLSEQLDAKFSADSEKDYNYGVVFVGNAKYLQAYYVNGLYTVKDGEVHLTVKVFRGQEEVATLDIDPGAAEDVVENLLQEVYYFLEDVAE
ncbi:MAG: hypothetical protein AAFZ52_10690, partial [Bacteroidota bacterium]